MEQIEFNGAERTINFKEFINALIEKWYITLITLVLCLLSALFYIKIVCIPMYSSTAKLFIFNTSNTQQSTSEITISSYLALDYSELITDRVVLEDVINNLNLNYSYSALRSMVTLYNPENTRIIEITVKTPQPRLSKNIANDICVVAQEKIVALMGIDRVNIISNAYLPERPSSPNSSKIITVAFLSGLAMSCLIVLLLYIRNDRISSAEDIEKYLQISVLGTIPYNRSKPTGVQH